MSLVTVECQLTYATEIDETDIETFFDGFHIITEIPTDVILDDVWIHTDTPGDELHIPKGNA